MNHSISENIQNTTHVTDTSLTLKQISENIESNPQLNKFYNDIENCFRKYLNETDFSQFNNIFKNIQGRENIKSFFEKIIEQLIVDKEKQRLLMNDIINVFKQNKLIPFISQEDPKWPREIYSSYSFQDLHIYYELFPIYKALDNKYYDEWSSISENEFVTIIQQTLKNNWWISKDVHLSNNTELSSVLISNNRLSDKDMITYLIWILRIFLSDLSYNWRISTISDLYNIINTYY